MNTFISGFLDNDSFFGRFMTKVGIIIAANLLFVIVSIPIITTGAGLVALYHVMLKMLRTKEVINPFKQFFIGFKNNFKQATIVWIITVALAIFGYVDIQICSQMGGVLVYFKYAIYVIGIICLCLFIFLLPVMAAFEDTIPHLIRNGLFFAVRRPLQSLVIIFFDVFPLYLTYTDLQYRPLYAFLWCFFGFGAIAMIGSYLLMPQFKEFLPAVDSEGTDVEAITDDEDTMLDDLRKMDGL